MTEWSARRRSPGVATVYDLHTNRAKGGQRRHHADRQENSCRAAAAATVSCNLGIYYLQPRASGRMAWRHNGK